MLIYECAVLVSISVGETHAEAVLDAEQKPYTYTLDHEPVWWLSCYYVE